MELSQGNPCLFNPLLTVAHEAFTSASLTHPFFPGLSFQGAAFGFHMIAAKAGEQLAPFLPQLVPRLYRYQFDPNLSIRQAMTSIWDALVTDKTLVVPPASKQNNTNTYSSANNEHVLSFGDNLRVFVILGRQVS